MVTDTETLTYDHIVVLALEYGFKLKPQADGRMALNDYVIDFARAVYDIGHAAAKVETTTAGAPMAMAQCHGSAEHPLYTADQLAAAVAAERERAARVCERIADDYNQRESLRYAELKTDAETGANECAAAIRAGAKEPSDG